MKVVVLAGGLGTRLQGEGSSTPKPMVEIGGYPVLWHIMKIYSNYGHHEFILALGYKGEAIKNYFLNYYYLHNSFTIQLGNGDLHVHPGKCENWTVHLADTGLHTQTGGRIKRLASWVANETFLMTYGDGVANIDINKLIAFHRQHGKLATITAVRPPSRFGGLSFNGNHVAQFVEKPQIGEGWINGGFFVLEPRVLDYLEGDQTIFEREPLERLASEEQLVAFRHEGFWQCLDTPRELRLLEGLWAEGKPPWKTWK